MASYEDDHNLKPSSVGKQPPQRPDLTDFLSTLNLSTTSAPNFPQSASAEPFTTLADAFRSLPVESEAIQNIVQTLLVEARDPSKREEGGGVPVGWEDNLERVDVRKLGDETCPICCSVFKEDPYPLVVRLPCDKRHVFDLECLQGWLRLHAT